MMTPKASHSLWENWQAMSASLQPTPRQAFQRLREGNHRFRTGQPQHPRQDPVSRSKLREAQQPFASILGCADSRVPPQLIFDQGLGDLFTNRIAGHVVDDAVIASLAYSVVNLQVPLIVVLGHKGCGAVQMTVDKVKRNEICDDAISHYICSAVKTAQDFSGELLDNAVNLNVRQTVEVLSKHSQFAASVEAGRLRIMGAVYDLETGEVVFQSENLQPQQTITRTGLSLV